ncbi:hypothetical protein CITRIK5_30133 [Citricoccus sp. K5]|nr:hypothetical protein CITRIK5_30133 [Citricoccus sp. K5]
MAGGHEDDLIQVQLGGHLRGGDEVPVVDGVEGATHDAQAEATVGHSEMRFRGGSVAGTLAAVASRSVDVDVSGRRGVALRDGTEGHGGHQQQHQDGEGPHTEDPVRGDELVDHVGLFSGNGHGRGDVLHLVVLP